MKKVNMLLAVLCICYYGNAQWVTSGNDIYTGNTGNVGIGTSTPGVKLDVNGYINTQRLTLANYFDNVLCSVDNGNNYQLIGTYRGWDSKGIYIAGYNAANAAASGTNMVTQNVYIGNPSFNSNFLAVNLMNGSVGIGTTAPGSFRLAVEGKIGAREVHVTSQTPWPDYVFTNDFQLKNLYNLESYIRQNNHLPNIPSAQEVKDNGIELGNMNGKLLEKIEELTMYIIELNKKIDKLEKEAGSKNK